LHAKNIAIPIALKRHARAVLVGFYRHLYRAAGVLAATCSVHVVSSLSTESTALS